MANQQGGNCGLTVTEMKLIENGVACIGIEMEGGARAAADRGQADLVADASGSYPIVNPG